MEQPKWKIWLSYLTEWHIESAPSPVNPHLYVSLRRGRYQLSTANAIYSYEDYYDNFLQAFNELALDRLSGDRVLLLGLGLGSIPLLLERIFEQNYRYTAVELDEAVIYLANKYGIADLRSPIETIQADAYAWVMQSQDVFDLICMDIFLDDTVPAAFEGIVFLEQLRERLAPGGLLMYNRLAANTADQEKSRRFYEERFLKVFPEGTYLDLDQNWMLLNHVHLLD